MEKELILQIIKKSLEINSREKNTVFINYYGHVNAFEIRIHLKRWEKNESPNYSRTIFMDNHNTENNERDLREVLEYLNKIKELSITDQSHDSSND